MQSNEDHLPLFFCKHICRERSLRIGLFQISSHEENLTLNFQVLLTQFPGGKKKSKIRIPTSSLQTMKYLKNTSSHNNLSSLHLFHKDKLCLSNYISVSQKHHKHL